MYVVETCVSVGCSDACICIPVAFDRSGTLLRISDGLLLSDVLPETSTPLDEEQLLDEWDDSLFSLQTDTRNPKNDNKSSNILIHSIQHYSLNVRFIGSVTR